MAGAIITARMDGEAARRAFFRLAMRMGDTTPIMGAIGTGLVEGTNDRARRAVDPDGQSWAPLMPAYAAIKRGPGILRASGELMDSITRRAGPTSVEVGTNRIYGGVHQHGATIKPVTAKRLVFRLAGGMVAAASVTIPARPFLGISAEDERMILDTLEDALDRALATGRK